MAGEIQIGGTTFATESGGTVTVSNVDSATNRTNLGLGSMATQNLSLFTGMIASFAMSSAPTGWLVCNGAEYAIADYGDLHTAIGTTWGALTNGSGGAGSTHFRVPDLRGAFLRGTGSHGSSTMANSSAFAGASVGSFENDQFQGFQVGGDNSGIRYGVVDAVGFETVGAASNSNYAVPKYNLSFSGYANMLTAVNDNTNGTPRKGDETRPFNAGINYCIKY